MRLKKKKPNIIFIVIDALRPGNLGCYGYTKPISQNIDKLSEEGLLFKHAYSCTNATDPSLTSIFSGKFCRSHGIMKHGASLQSDEVQAFLKSTRTLPEILKLNGYRTYAIDWLGRWHAKGYDYYSGILKTVGQWGRERLTYGQTREYAMNLAETRFFKRFSSLKSKIPTFLKQPNITPRTETYGDATAVTQKAKEIIGENLDQSFFLFLHYWDTHFPYNSLASIKEKPRKLDRNDREQLQRVKNKDKRKQIKLLGSVKRVLGMYDESIAFVDQEIGHLIETLRQKGILENTLIILTADHGESLTEHDIHFDHHGLYDETIHVPLIIKYAELPRAKAVKGFVQHVDIIPTILGILDIKGGLEYDGESLLPLIYEDKQLRSMIYAEETHTQRKQMIATHKLKYIRAQSEQDAVCKYCGEVHGGGIEELYDLEKDPGETKNVVAEHPGEAAKLEKKLSEWISNTESNRKRAMIRGRISLLKRQQKI